MSGPGPSYQQFNPFPPEDKHGYDIIVSLSQKQLQRQLEDLYNTPLPTASLPPPGTTLSDGPKEFLISHQLRVLLPRTSLRNPQRVYADDEREGILAHIACPEITLVPGKYRVVQLKFKLTAVPEGSAEKPFSANSVVQVLDDGKTYPITINDWTFSFEADLSTSAPMHIMNGTSVLQPKDLQWLNSRLQTSSSWPTIPRIRSCYRVKPRRNSRSLPILLQNLRQWTRAPFWPRPFFASSLARRLPTHLRSPTKRATT